MKYSLVAIYKDLLDSPKNKKIVNKNMLEQKNYLYILLDGYITCVL